MFSPLSPDSEMLATGRRAALCLGHPGHELQVFEWMHRTRPVVDVLTDGSGPGRPSRFAQTAALITGAGARLGVLRGRYPDRDFYELIRQKSPAPVLEMAERLATAWIAAEIETVAGDMAEGFSPTHDLCRMLINATVRRVERQTGRRILSLQFPLERLHLGGELPAGAVVVELTDAQFHRKREAALVAYPALAGEVERLIARFGEAAFKVEVLIPADARAGLAWDAPEPPFYETYGRRQIAQGHYQELITHAEHLRPLAEALYCWAED